MNSVNVSEDCAKQWEILLLLLSSEEKKIDRTSENEIDTMNYFYNNNSIRKILLHWLKQMKTQYCRKTSEFDTALKCDEVSSNWRQKGNEKFRTNYVEESYKCYVKSVMYAKHNGLMYSLALANRSAALLRLKRFQGCLSDIALALEHGYPVELRHKLLLRRSDCLIELRRLSEARSAIDEAVQHANSLQLSASDALEFDRHIKILEKKMESFKDDLSIDEEVTLPEWCRGKNPNFNAASGAIELRRNDTVGRHVVVTENTKRGDVLFSEEPYAWVALPSEDTVCEMCCAGDINPVPCSECSRSVYCGEGCRVAALAFHRWECAGAQFSLFPTIGIAHLALRVLLVSAKDEFPEPPILLNETTTAAQLFRSYSQVDNIKIYKEDTPAFFRMFNLVTNFDKMNNTDYVQYALTATMLTLYLEKYTSFFECASRKMPRNLPDEEVCLFAAALMLRSLGQLVCNGHATLSLCAVEEDDGNSGRTISEKEVRRATAIYPSAAMMNHSCEPNIINTFYRSRLIIRCSRELAAGSEVLNCYGPHRAREPTAQYMFTCSCSACSDGDRKNFASVLSAYACQSCKGPVSWQGRRAHFQPERALAQIDRADELATQAEQMASLEERCEKMQASYRLKQQVWHRQHASLRAAADRLARLYADLGEFSKSMELIKQNIQSLEYQFGSFSVEVAHELRKLSDERILSSPQHVDYSVAVSLSMIVTQFGVAVVYLLLAAQIIEQVFLTLAPTVTICIWYLVVVGAMTPLMLYGTPRDFSFLGVIAFFAAVVACILYFIQMMNDVRPYPVFRWGLHGFTDFFLAMGIMMFAFGGASTFPTIQNDMADKTKFNKSLQYGFTAMLALYLPIATAGYAVYGESVSSNFVTSLGPTALTLVGNVLMSIHLICAFIILINPVCQEVEELYSIPRDSMSYRALARLSIMACILFIGESIPRFYTILALVGGSTVAFLTFVLPSYCYLNLVGQTPSGQQQPEQPAGWVRIVCWHLVVAGVVVGAAASCSAVSSIFSTAMVTPCYLR